MAVLRVYWRTLKHISLRGYVYVWANLFWVLLTVPIVTAPAAWAGLARLSHAAHTRPTVSLSDFWDGFRAHFWRGLILGAVTALIVVVNVSNLLAYASDDGALMPFLRAAWITAIIFWLSLMLYVWVIFEEMEQPTLIGGLRNALIMVLRSPFFTLGLWPGIILLAVLSTIFFPAWLLLTGSTIAALGTTAVLDRLEAAGLRSPTHAAPEDDAL
ncbi:MAG TPA: DUF624 domain-containing protein [Aggregatilineales bacterium]|nr:DUF624 domain-containing protein [Aggregatilineales bacterium]